MAQQVPEGALAQRLELAAATLGPAASARQAAPGEARAPQAELPAVALALGVSARQQVGAVEPPMVTLELAAEQLEPAGRTQEAMREGPLGSR